MSSKHLRILNVEPASAWADKMNKPRFLQPREMSRMPCNVCPGHCCSPVGNLSITEALRIALMLRVPMDGFLERRRVGETRYAESGRREAIPLDEGDMLLFLRVEGDARKCVFLHRLGERGFCSIYAARPGICRIYPFEVQWGSRHLRVGTTMFCPVGWLQDDETVKKATADMAQWDEDDRLHAATIKAWNKRTEDARDWSSFVEFAVRRLARKLGHDADEVLRGPRKRLARLGGAT